MAGVRELQRACHRRGAFAAVQSALLGGFLSGCLPAASLRPLPSPSLWLASLLSTRWVLVYAGGPEGRWPPYTTDDFIHLIAQVDTTGRAADWLCTGAIFLNLNAPSGRVFTTWVGGTAANGDDWRDYLDSLFLPHGALARLDSAVGRVSESASRLGRPYPVSLMIPYPEPNADTLRFLGRRYVLKGLEGRAGSAEAYVGEAVTRFRLAEYPHLALDGFYWLNESIHGPDEALLPKVGAAVHRAGFRFLWIPFYTAWGWADWRRWGFDEAWLQPNYFFDLSAPGTLLDSAAARAQRFGMGLEIEFDGRLYAAASFANRLHPYLVALRAHPELRSRAVTIYEGGGALLYLSRSSNARDREEYRQFAEALRWPDGGSEGHGPNN